MQARILHSVLAGAMLAPAALQAQPPDPPPPDQLIVVENLPPVPTLGARIDIIRAEGGVPGPVVEGKPYSARAITEWTQTLSDGNRIVQRSEAMIYRDSEGRTRREQTLGGVGQWRTDRPVTMIHIHDPVAGKSYVLDPDARTAREIRSLQVAIARAENVEGVTTETRAVYGAGEPLPAPGAPVAGVTVVRGAEGAQEVRVFGSAAGFAVAPIGAAPLGNREPPEDLGEQVIEGLLVRGTRSTDTIPAGMLGNERPIEIVTERWYSKDIDAIVLQRFSDPRSGESTYRLVNVALGEQPRDLFEVPQGYEIEKADAPRAALRALPPQTIRAERVEPPAQ